MVGSGTYTPTTDVADVPSNRAVAVLDTGTSWSYVYGPRFVILILIICHIGMLLRISVRLSIAV